jgi:hypothetical protein
MSSSYKAQFYGLKLKVDEELGAINKEIKREKDLANYFKLKGPIVFPSLEEEEIVPNQIELQESESKVCIDSFFSCLTNCEAQ